MVKSLGMAGNPHYEAAADGPYKTQAEAILALAYEQRTANMIAAATAVYPNGSGMFPRVSDGCHAAILARLGLNEGATS